MTITCWLWVILLRKRAAHCYIHNRTGFKVEEIKKEHKTHVFRSSSLKLVCNIAGGKHSAKFSWEYPLFVHSGWKEGEWTEITNGGVLESVPAIWTVDYHKRGLWQKGMRIWHEWNSEKAEIENVLWPLSARLWKSLGFVSDMFAIYALFPLYSFSISGRHSLWTPRWHTLEPMAVVRDDKAKGKNPGRVRAVAGLLENLLTRCLWKLE
jgi:hypothetical protein